MILEILRLARRLDKKLEETLGKPYRVILSVGLVAAIVDQVHALMHVSFTKTGYVQTSIGILLGLLLLINQMGELANRMEQRPPRRSGSGPGRAERMRHPDS